METRQPPRPPEITLVNPPRSPEELAGSFRRVAPVVPPLGLACLAAVLEEAGFPVRIVDCVALRHGIPDLVAEISRQDPDVIGFTATVASFHAALEASQTVRERFPNRPLVIGGPHFTSLPEESFALGPFDFGVVGEGEITALELMRSLRDGREDFSGLEGLLWRRGGKIVSNPKRPLVADLDTLPLPARHLLPGLEFYRPMIAGFRRLPAAPLVTSRGCPFRCTFCDRAVFGNRFRFRSAGKVMEELEELVRRYGAREVRFYDDHFTASRARVLVICGEMARRGMDLAWTCAARVDGVDEELLGSMKRAGCWQIDFGLESGDPGILESMGKGVTLEQNEAAVRAARRAGLEVRAYFVLGMPGETRGTIRRTFDFAVKLDLDIVAFYALAAYPGSEMFSRLKNAGRLLHQDFRQYVSTIDLDKTRLHTIPDGMTEREFKRLLGEIHRRYYLRPGYLMKRIRSIRSLLDIRRYATALRTILTYGR